MNYMRIIYKCNIKQTHDIRHRCIDCETTRNCKKPAFFYTVLQFKKYISKAQHKFAHKTGV